MGSRGHRCWKLLTPGEYRVSWVVAYDAKDVLPGPPFKKKRLFERITDEAGARRFCKKWGLEFPKE